MRTHFPQMLEDIFVDLVGGYTVVKFGLDEF